MEEHFYSFIDLIKEEKIKRKYQKEIDGFKKEISELKGEEKEEVFEVKV